MITLIDILKKSEEYLAKYGIPDARHNAELLAGNVLGKSRIQLYLEYDKPIGENEIARIRTVLAERKARKPVQYIFGETEFYGLPFGVNPNVLIPRPETELLVEETLKLLAGIQGNPVVYDVGTGSGCIGICIAKHNEKCFIYASDVCAEALKTASANAGRNGVSEKMQFLLGQVFKPFADAGIPKADIVVSNPPYILSADIDTLQPEVKNYEPRKALDGGADGLDIIRRLITDFQQNANAGGALIMEIGYKQSGSVSRLIEDSGMLKLLNITKDYQGIDRIISAKLKD
jgi:release factor glutamine methyltransferase